MSESITVALSFYELDWVSRQFVMAYQRANAILKSVAAGETVHEKEYKQARTFAPVLEEVARELEIKLMEVVGSFELIIERREELKELLETAKSHEVRDAANQELSDLPTVPNPVDLELDKPTLKFIIQLTDKHVHFLREKVIPAWSRATEEQLMGKSQGHYIKRAMTELDMVEALRSKLQKWL